MKKPPKKLRPYLEENVVSGDKFNIFAFGGLLTLIFFVGLWVYSSSDLLGNFGQWLGIIKTPVPVIAVNEVPENENNTVKFFEIPNPSPTLPAEGGQGSPPLRSLPTQPDTSDNSTETFYSTPTPKPKVLTLLPTITPEGPQDIEPVIYDANGIYTRSSALEAVYSSMDPDYIINGKYSYYWPPWGGINCDTINGVEECIYMASGEKALDHIGIAWACDFSIPLQSVIYIQELDLYGICKDRGYMIKQDTDGLYWFDQLLDYGMLGWAEPMTIEVYEFE